MRFVEISLKAIELGPTYPVKNTFIKVLVSLCYNWELPRASQGDLLLSPVSLCTVITDLLLADG